MGSRTAKIPKQFSPHGFLFPYGRSGRLGQQMWLEGDYFALINSERHVLILNTFPIADGRTPCNKSDRPGVV